MRLNKIFVLTVATLFLSSWKAQNSGKVVKPQVSPAIRFTENNGQWGRHILFRSMLPGGMLFIESNCLTYNFYDAAKLKALHLGGLAKGECADFSIRGHAYKVIFENAKQAPAAEKMQMASDYENFYIGNNSDKWRAGVRNYGQVWLRGLYEGIDYEMLAAAGGAKYNFHVKPGADVYAISMRFEGVEDLRLRKGVLHIKTSVNEVIEQKPYAYQLIGGEVKEVPCRFSLKGQVLSFVFPEGYDRSAVLVIDPVLVFSAQIGSIADNFGMTATFDHSGNLYSAGTVYAPGYPITLGAFDNTYNNQQEYGVTDVFVTKYNATGTSLLYSTYLGGNSTEVCSSLIVDNNNNLCLYGATGSSNFPVTAGAVSPAFNGGDNIGFISNGSVFQAGTDIYVSKFNAGGTALLASTYFGGSGNDGINYLGAVIPVNYNLFPAPGTGVTNSTGYDSLLTNYGDQYRGEIQLDSLGNIYICSSTRSADLPIVGGFDNTLGGKQDAVIAKFNSGLTNLLYSTYLGGSQIDCGNTLYVTPSLDIYATGGTCSSDLPGTAGAHSPNYNGGKTDGFLSRISQAGALLRTTYIGTSSYDNSFFVQCNKYGDVFVYGQSLGSMPIQNLPGSTVFSVPNTHQFISCYNSSLTVRKMSTVFGSKVNGIDISPSAFAVDECNGNIYLSGWGGGLITNTVGLSNMPLMNPNQGTTTGYDFYLMALKPYASALLYGSYYGGHQSQEHVDGGTSRFDRRGVIYQSVCAGCGAQQDFPITPGAWPCPGNPNCATPNKSGNCNNGVFKINFDLQAPVSSISTHTNEGCAPLTVTLVNAKPGTSFKWYFENGTTSTVISKPVLTFATPGTHSVSLVVRDTSFCVSEDSTTTFFTVHAAPQPTLNLNTSPCSNTISLNASLPAGAGDLQWNLGDGTTATATPLSHTYSANGIFTISLSATNSLSCKGTETRTVSVLDFQPEAAGGGSVCSGSSIELMASGGTSYNWTPGASLSSSTIPQPAASPTANTIYTVTVTDSRFGQSCAKAFTAEVQVKPSPTADFEYTVHPCGGSVLFNDKSVTDIVSWDWTFNAAESRTVTNPNFYFTEGGTQTVSLVSTNAHGCSSRRIQSFYVEDATPFLTGSVNICIGEDAELQAGGGYDYHWLPEESVEQPFLPVTIVRPVVTTEYSVIILASKNNSITNTPCEYTLTSLVKVSELSKNLQISASASPDEIIAGNSTTLTYVGDAGAQVIWLPQHSTNPGMGYSVTASPLAPMVYTVVASREACEAVLEVPVMVYSNKCLRTDVFVPNTFTPNKDGSNDVFRVRGLSVDEVYFAVYNRWGEKVFETSDKNGGWNGMYREREAETGVFGWYLKVKCHNGEETFLKGNVTLIR